MQDIVSGVAPRPQEQPGSTHHAPETRPRKQTTEESDGSVKVSAIAKAVAMDKAKAQAEEPVSKDELAEMLRKFNLTFDLFEIEAQYSVEDNGHRIRIVIQNTKTGEIIRKIPPYEFVTNYQDVRAGLGTLINESV